MTSISERVARGTAWLDANQPGWDRKIDLGSLDIERNCLCVLGQIYGDFAERPKVIGVGYAMGFNTHGGFRLERATVDFMELQAEWVRVITERREAADRG